jgi:hypothetical protein
MRRALCINRNTCTAFMRHILNRAPVLAMWAPRMLNLWNQFIMLGSNDILAQSLQVQLDQPGSGGYQVLQLIKAVPGDHTTAEDARHRPEHISTVTITAIAKALVAREDVQAWAQS